jgi:hypothetical protein
MNEELFTMNLKQLVNCEKKALTIIYKNEKLTEDEENIKYFVEKYKKFIQDNKGCAVIIDLRSLKKINYEFVWKNMNKVKEIDDIIKDNVTCISYIINSGLVKKLTNAILKVYKPVVDVKICTNNKEVIEFIKKH